MVWATPATVNVTAGSLATPLATATVWVVPPSTAKSTQPVIGTVAFVASGVIVALKTNGTFVSQVSCEAAVLTTTGDLPMSWTSSPVAFE